MRYLLLLLIPFQSYCQTYENPNGSRQKVDVTIKSNEDPYTSAYNKSMNAYSESEKARAATLEANARVAAARSEALKNNFTKIRTDLLINNDSKYKAVVLNSTSGWKPNVNKTQIKKILKGSNKYYFYDGLKKLPSSFSSSEKVLYLDWIREAPTEYDRITTLILKDVSGKVVYEATYQNISYSEMLFPLTTSYIMSKKQAVEKAKEFKELFELDIISEEEYLNEISKLKKIILTKP